MRNALILMLTVSATAVAQNAAVPLSISHVDVGNKKSGWIGTVLLLDTPDEQGNLAVKIVQIQKDGTNRIISNNTLVDKQEDPSLSDIAKTYESNVSVQDSTGSIILS